MTIEEINKWLDNEYGVSYTRLEELHDFYFEKYCDLQQENQELKQKYENAVADYETTMSELQELKKQLEEKNKPQIFIDTQDMEERYSEGLYQDYLEEENKKYKNQQKEFIKWLEDYLNLFDDMCIDEQGYYDMCEEILQKYKSIIGVSDENNMEKSK